MCTWMHRKDYSRRPTSLYVLHLHERKYLSLPPSNGSLNLLLKKRETRRLRSNQRCDKAVFLHTSYFPLLTANMSDKKLQVILAKRRRLKVRRQQAEWGKSWIFPPTGSAADSTCLARSNRCCKGPTTPDTPANKSHRHSSSLVWQGPDPAGDHWQQHTH